MSRDMILGRVRRNVKSTPDRLKAVEARLEGAQGHRDDWVPLPDAELVDVFIEKAKLAAASVERVQSDADAAEAIATYLRSRNLPLRVRTGDDPRLKALLENRPGIIEVAHGKAVDADEAGLSHAFAGIAEAGTLVLTSGADNPTSLNFLPPNHLVVIRAGDIARSYEQVWARLKRQNPQGLPRTVNFITGPSRSADIEQTLLLGAHGPKNLHILVME